MSSVIAVVILTRNEELAIRECISSARLIASDIVVIDSASTDNTASIAVAEGARVIQFNWNGRYPKKKEWGLRQVDADWVLLLDADERLSPDLARELTLAAEDSRSGIVAYDIPLQYYWRGVPLRYGQIVKKRSFLRPSQVAFPEVPDLAAPGITEVEGHYQPVANGVVATTLGRIVHDDPDPISDWYARHNRYSDWEAYLRTDEESRNSVRSFRSSQGKAFERLPFKPLAIFAYTYLLRSGWRDGRAGFEYALSLAFYQFQISVKVRERRGRYTERAAHP